MRTYTNSNDDDNNKNNNNNIINNNTAAVYGLDGLTRLSLSPPV